MYRIEDYPQIRDSYYVSDRLAGVYPKLRGKVAVITFFVKSFSGDFSEKTLNQYYRELQTAFSMLEKEAHQRGVFLKLDGYHYHLDMPPDTSPKSGYAVIRSFLSISTLKEAQDYFKKNMDVDQVSLVVVYDKYDRSFAKQHNFKNSKAVYKLPVIFQGRSGYSAYTIAHELLHQFGAEDLYYPKKICECAEYYLRDSIMGIGKRDVVDDFTAYLIGWKDTVSAKTWHFLNASTWVTKNILEDAMRREWMKEYV